MTETTPLYTDFTQGVCTIVLNRLNRLNSLNHEMILAINTTLSECEDDKACRAVLLTSNDQRAFCAGGDIKDLYSWLKSKDYSTAEKFLLDEYNLQLRIHQFPKPVIAFTQGITMGGGMGLIAGADIIISDNTTAMAMPETRIGFFPDAGSTGWLTQKCGYEYGMILGLAGIKLKGYDTVASGLSDYCINKEQYEDIITRIQSSKNRNDHLIVEIKEYCAEKTHESEKTSLLPYYQASRLIQSSSSLLEFLALLEKQKTQDEDAAELLKILSTMSPTGLTTAWHLISQNHNREMSEVFASEFKAISYLLRLSDFTEGIRAQVIDRDFTPQWSPQTVNSVDTASLHKALD